VNSVRNDFATFMADAPLAPLHDDPTDPRPARRLAVLTCMDARIEPLSALGLRVGDAHVLRNAGGRVTEDVLRSVAFAAHILEVDTVVVVHHTGCGLVGRHDEELRDITGADVEFHPITDHAAAIRDDVATLARTPYLGLVQRIGGFRYDLGSREVEEFDRWARAGR
jgi:carbonic anhydrase